MVITNKIGLGTVQFGMDYGISNKFGKTPDEEVVRILSYAKKNGITTIDTASAYGHSEEILGKNDLKQFNVVSKFMPSEKETIKEQLINSLNKLNLSSLYGYLAHRPLKVLEDTGLWKILTKYKREGKIRKIGFSFNEPDELTKVIDAEFIPDLIQVPFNLMDQRFQDHMKILKLNGCEIHTRSVFLQGLLLRDPKELDSYFDEIKKVLVNLQEHKDKLPILLLKWVLQHDFIDKVIIGVNNLQQLEQIIVSIEQEKENLSNIEVEISDNILVPSKWPTKK